MEGTRHEEGEPIEDPGNGEQNKRKTYGPLEVERHRKDDGRALILFTVAKHGEE